MTSMTTLTEEGTYLGLANVNHESFKVSVHSFVG